MAKWLSAQVLDANAHFAESIARQLKSNVLQNRIQLAGLACLADWIESPQHSIWQQVAVADTLTQALSLQSQLSLGQSILSLDGYHVGVDWVIGLFYDEASQAGQGVLSHRIRLDEIEIHWHSSYHSLKWLNSNCHKCYNTFKPCKKIFKISKRR